MSLKEGPFSFSRFVPVFITQVCITLIFTRTQHSRYIGTDFPVLAGKDEKFTVNRWLTNVIDVTYQKLERNSVEYLDDQEQCIRSGATVKR
jgi:hypothetical protein